MAIDLINSCPIPMFINSSNNSLKRKLLATNLERDDNQPDLLPAYCPTYWPKGQIAQRLVSQTVRESIESSLPTTSVFQILHLAIVE